jgi:hypothetical protein
VKYFQPDDIGIWSYYQDVSKSGALISSDIRIAAHAERGWKITSKKA